MTRHLPHDTGAEQVVLGALMVDQQAAPAVWERVRPEEFYASPHQSLAALLKVMTDEQASTDPVAVFDRIRRSGLVGKVPAPYLHTCIASVPVAVAAEHYAGIVHETYLRRQVFLAADRAIQQAENPTTDLSEIGIGMMYAGEEIAKASEPVRVQRPPTEDEFLAGPLDYDWSIPGLLERGDKVLVTAHEGTGKSTFMLQLGVCAAAGIHPFSGQRVAPMRVLLLDLENETRSLRRRMGPLVALADQHRRPTSGRLSVISIPAGMDVTESQQGGWLAGQVDACRPDLIVGGPLYRMHHRSLSDEENAREVTVALDALKARAGAALVLEGHAPKGQDDSGSRDLRPRGSALLLGWFGYGLGLRPASAREQQDSPQWGGRHQTWVLHRWRGDRDKSAWPHRLRHGTGQEWPWVSLDHPEAVAS